VSVRLREKHFRNTKAGKDLRSQNSSHRSFTLRRIRQAHRWRDGGVGVERERNFLHPNWLQRSDLPAKARFSWRDGGQGAWPRYWRAGLAWPDGLGVRSQKSEIRSRTSGVSDFEFPLRIFWGILISFILAARGPKLKFEISEGFSAN
jgi:hypothetical protein